MRIRRFGEVNKMLPHHLHRKGGVRALACGTVASSLVSGLFATVLYSAGIPVMVILPTVAPIWASATTVLFMFLRG